MNGGPDGHDPITFAVIKSALDTIVDDMAYAVMRTARSPIVRDVLDYSVTLCDRQGPHPQSQAKTVALHLGAVPDAMDVVLERFSRRPRFGRRRDRSSTIPYDGGMHLPDIFMFKPIFSGERRAAGLLGGDCSPLRHVGGRVPGSNASRFDGDFPGRPAHRANETLRAGSIPNKHAAGKIIEKNVRLPEMVLGDLDAQYATCNGLASASCCRLFDRLRGRSRLKVTSIA